MTSCHKVCHKVVDVSILVLFTLSGEVASNLQPTTPAGMTGVSVVLLGMVLLLSIYTSRLVKALECAHYINLALPTHSSSQDSIIILRREYYCT